MANETVNVGLNVDAGNSINNITASVEKAVVALNKLVASATSAGKAVSALSQGQSGGSLADRLSGVQQNVDYNKQRSVVGTGGSTRDFAQQAQGLGGLVHLYATFGANVFALGAAFRALEESMNTTNMIQGLDQLSAASGRALGSLAKSVAAATDGAVSLREAMQATAQATAAGISGSQFIKLAEGAKNAADVLGRSVPDALNRITLGISKTEARLLDELGIFVKVQDANEKYARSLGVTAESLTLVQRKAAFTNEALTQLETKFSEATVPANPYNKLAASLENLAQSTLAFINETLAPIAKYLSEHSGVLTAIVSALVINLTTRAIPALTNWQKSLIDTANIAASSAAKMRDAFDHAFAEKQIDRLNLKQLDADLATAKAKVVDFQNDINKHGAQPPTAGLQNTGFIQQYLDKDAARIARADLEGLNRLLGVKLDKLATIQSGEITASKLVQENTKKEIAYLTEEIAQTEQLLLLRKQVVAATQAQAEADAKLDAAEKAGPAFGSAEQVGQVKIRAAEMRAAALNALSGVSEQTRVTGILDSLGKLNTRLTDEGIIGWTKWSTFAKGAIVSVGTRLSDIASLLAGPVMIAVTLAVGAFQLLDAAFSNNAKSAHELSTALDILSDTGIAAGNTIEALLIKGKGKAYNIETIQATATAIDSITEAANNAFTAFSRFEASSTGTWDSMKEGIASLFGGGARKDLAKSLATALAASIKLAVNDPKVNEAKQQLNSLLNITDINTTSATTLVNIFKNLDSTKLSDAIKIVGELDKSVKKTADSSKNLDDAFKQGILDFQTLSQSFMPKDQIAKIGTDLISIGSDFAKTLDNPIQKFQEMAALVNNISKMQLLDSADNAQLLAAKTQIEALKADAELASRNLMTLQKEAIKAREAQTKTFSIDDAGSSAPAFYLDAINKTIEEADAAVAKAQAISADMQTKMIELATRTLPLGITNSIAKGSELIAVSIGMAFDKASIAMQQASLIGASGAGLADAQYNVTVQQIAIETNLLNAQIANTDATYKLTDAMSQARIDNLRKQGSGIADEQASILTRQLQERQNFLELGRKDPIAAIQGITEKLKTNLSDQVRDELNGILKIIETFAGQAAQRRTLEAQASSADSTRRVGQITESTATKTASIQLDQQRLVLTQQRADILKSVVNYESDYFILQSQGLVSAQQINKERLEDLGYQDRIAKLQVSISKGNEFAGQQLAIENSNHAKVLQSRKLENDAIREKQALELANYNLAKLIADLTLNQKVIDSQTSQAQDRLEIAKAELDYLSAINHISESALATRQKDIDLQKQELTYRSQIFKLTTDQQIAQATAADRYAASIDSLSSKAAVNSTGSNLNDPSRVQAQADLNALTSAYLETVSRITTEYGASGAALDSVNAKIIRQIELTDASKQHQVAYNAQMEKLVDITSALASVFGSVGETFGKGMQNILKVTKDNVDKRAKLESDYNKKKDANLGDFSKSFEQTSKEDLKIEKEYSDASTQLQVQRYANTAGAVADLFDKKTAAYQAFHAFEVGLHAIELAMDIEKILSDIGVTSSHIVQTGIRAAASGVEAVIRTIASLPFPANLAAGAAVAAVIVGLLSKIGKSSTYEVPGGVSAKDRQETQGTGQTWQADANGNMVKTDTGGGVLGDSSAKSDSIKNSLKILANNSVEGLDYDNDILKTLQSINVGINGLSSILYTVGGLTKGSKFGTVDGQVSNTPSGLASFTTSTTIFGDKLASITNAILGSTKITKVIEDSGIAIKGTFLDLMKDTAGTLSQYETDLITKNKSSLFGLIKSTSTSLETQYASLGSDVTKSISDIFANAGDIFLELGAKVGITTASITNSLAKLDVSQLVSLKGLKGSDLTDALNAIIGSILDTASKNIFITFSKYAQVGEGMLQTVIRVVDGNDKLKQSFDSVGKTVLGITTDISEAAKNFDISESLINKAGGDLSTLVSSIKGYHDDFLTPAEQLAPVAKAVSKELTNLGLSSITTMDQFKQVVNSIDLTTDAGQQLYLDLLNVSGGFAQVHASSVTAMTALEIASKRIDLLNQALVLQGKSTAALTLQRTQELNAIDDSLKPMQLYVYALQDEADLKSQLTSAYETESQAIQGTIDSLDASAKALQEYKTSLITGTSSLNTPQETYMATSKVLEDLKDVIGKTPSTDAEKTAQADALSKLPAASDAFLAASRVVNASSEQYQNDFQSVLQLLDSTSANLSGQESNAQKQLDSLKASVSNLIDISGAVKTTAEILVQLQKAQKDVEKTQYAYYDSITKLSEEGNTFLQYIVESTEGTQTSVQMLTDYMTRQSALDITEALVAANIINDLKDTGTKSTILPTPTSGASIQSANDSNYNSGGGASSYSVAAYASGGTANGLALVGEQGPELVNFNKPAMVYNAGSTQDILGNRELLDEVRKLREEVAKLRADQSKQTGDLISSNYDANDQAATKVVDGNASAVNKASWSQANKPKLVA